MNEIQIIGVDNGYGNTKGRETCIPSGVKKLPMKPPIETRTVEYNGEYFAVGSQKMTIQKSKTDNEDTLILTMAIVAEELKKKGSYSADIRLAVGLPLTRMGAEKIEFANYMLRNRRLNFRYEGMPYSVYIVSVDVFPQGYAAVVNRLNTFKTSTVVIDVGSWTIDVLTISEGQPDISRCKSLPLGTITAMNDINESLRQKFNGEADEVIIKEVMINGTSNINNLRSLKFNSALTDFVFIGGGASVIKHFCKEIESNITIIEDVNINAKGYEEILRHKYKVAS